MGFRGELNAVYKKKELTRGRAVAERLAVLNEQHGVGVYFDRGIGDSRTGRKDPRDAGVTHVSVYLLAAMETKTNLDRTLGAGRCRWPIPCGHGSFSAAAPSSF